MTTDREAALLARIKELEAEADKRRVVAAQGGVFESWWQLLKAIVPAPLAVTAVAVFLAHHGFSYYVQTQMVEAETQLKEAQSVAAKLQTDALNGKAGAEPMRVATLRAEAQKKQAEAARARTEAAAQTAEVDNQTARLATLKAQLDSAQNQARLARAKADAEMTSSGLRTLQDREVRAKATIAQLKALGARSAAAQLKAMNEHGQMSLGSQSAAALQALCTGNPYAQQIGCPAQYVRSQPPTPAYGGADGTNRSGGRFATIKAINANLRSCPEASSRCEPIIIAPQGFRVKILGQADNGWYNVEVTDQHVTYHGYISGKVLDME